jgi:hypothetical protein
MFKIGQKVVCKTVECFWGIPFGIVKGQIYEIENIIKCPGCGSEMLLLNTHSFSNKSCKCGYSKLPDNSFHSWRFEPLKYDLLDNKDIISELIEERADIKVPELVEN